MSLSPLIAFALTIVLAIIFLSWLRLQPFISLVLSAAIYGMLVGLGSDVASLIAGGLGAIFSSLGLVIFSGAVIAEHLRQTGSTSRVVADLLFISRKKSSLVVSGASGYLVALPSMCCITAYIILEPVVSFLGGGAFKKNMLFMAAASSVVSFVLVYPSPVVVAAARAVDVGPRQALEAGVLLSVLLMALVYVYLHHLSLSPQSGPGLRGDSGSGSSGPGASRLEAWGPMALPLALILAGAYTQLEGLRFLGNPSMALLAGALLAVALSRRRGPEMVQVVLNTATRRAGIILLDLCGAGAFGYVISHSGLPAALQGALVGLPLILVPFLISALLQLAQGSRVVTVILAGEMLKGYDLAPVELMLLVCLGALSISYVTDPYFWLVKETTGSSMRETVLGYTLPLSLCALAGFVAVVVWSTI